MNLAFRLARREMRSGLGGFRLFIACLALGVAAIAAILSFSRAGPGRRHGARRPRDPGRRRRHLAVIARQRRSSRLMSGASSSWAGSTAARWRPAMAENRHGGARPGGGGARRWSGAIRWLRRGEAQGQGFRSPKRWLRRAAGRARRSRSCAGRMDLTLGDRVQAGDVPMRVPRHAGREARPGLHGFASRARAS